MTTLTVGTSGVTNMGNVGTKRSCGAMTLGLSVLLAAAAGSASAAPTYSYFYAAGQSSFSAPAGSVVAVPIYLREVSTDNTSLINHEGGLFEGSVSVGPLTAPLAADFTGNAGVPPVGFDQAPQKLVTGSTLSLSEANALSDTQGVNAIAFTTNVYRVFLGTVNVKAPASAGQQATFTVSPADPGFGASETNGPDFYDLDDNTGSEATFTSAAATNFTVTATPEPTSLALCALTGLAAVQRRRRVTR